MSYDFLHNFQQYYSYHSGQYYWDKKYKKLLKPAARHAVLSTPPHEQELYSQLHCIAKCKCNYDASSAMIVERILKGCK